jgi:hypothetical protein
MNPATRFRIPTVRLRTSAGQCMIVVPLTLRAMRPDRRARLLALLLVVPVPLAAQDPAAAPRAVADSFFRFIADERYLDAARLMDVEAFDAYRRDAVSAARRPQARPVMTAEQLQKLEPKMPRSVAEYQVKRMNEQAATMAPYLRHEFGYSTIDSIAAAPAEQALARSLEAHDIRTMMREALDRRRGTGCPVPAAALAASAATMRLRAARVIGVVVDGDSIAYVLHDDPSMDDRAYLDQLPPAERAEAVAAMKRSARPWVEMAPPVTVLRRVGARWVVGTAMRSGMAIGVDSQCAEATSPKKKPKKG